MKSLLYNLRLSNSKPGERDILAKSKFKKKKKIKKSTNLWIKRIANSFRLTQRHLFLSLECRHQGDLYLGGLLEAGPALHFVPLVTLPCLT